MEDGKILSLLLARLEAGLEALAKKYGPRLLQTARNILGQAQDAEEVVNDTYLAVWNAIPPAQPDPLAGYVYRVGRNVALKRLRTNQALKRDGGYQFCLEELAESLSGGNLEELWDARELGQAIDRFLAKMSPANRRLFLRRYWFGDRVKDLAAEEGTTEAAVTARLSRMRQGLKAYLLQEGYYGT